MLQATELWAELLKALGAQMLLPQAPSIGQSFRGWCFLWWVSVLLWSSLCTIYPVPTFGRGKFTLSHTGNPMWFFTSQPRVCLQFRKDFRLLTSVETVKTIWTLGVGLNVFFIL